jgi:hypothetical protein
MSRKDIFYSGSVTNLKEYQSQKSLTDYRNSVVSLTRFEKEHRNDVPRYQDLESAPADPCPCLNLPPAFKAALSSMLDVTLLKDPAFMLIGISNLFGMAALYIPFFYLVDAATKNVSWLCHRLEPAVTLNFFLFSRELNNHRLRSCCQLSESPTPSLVSFSATLQTSHQSMPCS